MNPIPWLLAAAVRWLTPLPAPPVITAAQLAPPPVPSAKPAAPLSAEDTALAPDPSGVLDLAAAAYASVAADDRATPVNPFRCRYHARPPTRSQTVVLAGIVRGPDRATDCCVLNGEPVGVGEAVDGLVVCAIGDTSVTLRAGAQRVRIPLQAGPILLRLPL